MTTPADPAIQQQLRHRVLASVPLAVQAPSGTHVVILAAGQGTRFQAQGGATPKLTANVHGLSLAGWTQMLVQQAVSVLDLPVHIVVGLQSPIVSSIQPGSFVTADRAREGLHESVAAGLRHVGSLGGTSACILLADAPLCAFQLAPVLEHAATAKASQTIACRRSTGGPHPVWVGDLSAGLGGLGRGALSSRPDVIWIDAPPTSDVDIPSDLHKLEASLHNLAVSRDAP